MLGLQEFTNAICTRMRETYATRTRRRKSFFGAHRLREHEQHSVDFQDELAKAFAEPSNDEAMTKTDATGIDGEQQVQQQQQQQQQVQQLDHLTLMQSSTSEQNSSTQTQTASPTPNLLSHGHHYASSYATMSTTTVLYCFFHAISKSFINALFLHTGTPFFFIEHHSLTLISEATSTIEAAVKTKTSRVVIYSPRSLYFNPKFILFSLKTVNLEAMWMINPSKSHHSRLYDLYFGLSRKEIRLLNI